MLSGLSCSVVGQAYQKASMTLEMDGMFRKSIICFFVPPYPQDACPEYN